MQNQTRVFYYYCHNFKLSELPNIIGSDPFIDIEFIFRENEGIEIIVIREDKSK